MKSVADLIKDDISGFVDSLPGVIVLAPQEFEKVIRAKVDSLEAICAELSEEKPEIMKFFYDLCGAEVERGIMIRHKVREAGME